MQVYDQYYIYDTDRLIWSILFPFRYWFVSHSVYQIDAETYEELKIPDQEKRSKTWLIIMILTVSVPTGRVLATYVYIIFLGLSLLGGFAYVELKDFLMGVCFAAFVCLFLLTNTVAIPVGAIQVTDITHDDKPVPS